MAVVVSAAVVVEAVLEQQPARSAAVKVAAMIALMDFFIILFSSSTFDKDVLQLRQVLLRRPPFCRVVVGGVERRFLGIGMLYGAEHLFLYKKNPKYQISI